MATKTRTRLIAVGACAIDNILTVPHYPSENSKLRATSLTKRRGGNAPNTLEVLQQLIDHEYNGLLDNEHANNRREAPELYLLAVLPRKGSAATHLMAESFRCGYNIGEQDATSAAAKGTPGDNRKLVDLSHCIYRTDHEEPISSYVIASESNGSRTIVNHNLLPEMTFDEFVQNVEGLLIPVQGSSSASINQIWFHFEGRTPETTLRCMHYLREHHAFKKRDGLDLTLKISTELEKPGREGLQELAFWADVVYYSKAWAQHEKHATAALCLSSQKNLMQGLAAGSDPKVNKLLVCSWGKNGADLMKLLSNESSLHHGPAYVPLDQHVVDTTGAGDTFLAGILFGCICRGDGDHRWGSLQMLDFANGLAGRKILQQGFDELGALTIDLKRQVDTSP